MWPPFVFAGIGVFVGVATRLGYNQRKRVNTLAIMLLGAVGGLAGGMMSWIYWPEGDKQLQIGNLIVSAIGAVFAIQFWATMSFAQRIRRRRQSAS